MRRTTSPLIATRYEETGGTRVSATSLAKRCLRGAAAAQNTESRGPWVSSSAILGVPEGGAGRLIGMGAIGADGAFRPTSLRRVGVAQAIMRS